MKHTKRAQIISASAGSGKTYRLAYKYVHDAICCEDDNGRFDPTAYRRILAVTFTNKATEEMKSRILIRINELAEGEKSPYLEKIVADSGLSKKEIQRRAMILRSAILHDYSRFTVLTNDRFFQRILRAFIKELGLELNYSLELDTAPITTKSADALIQELTSNRELYDWIVEMASDSIEAGERWNIRESILKLGKELFNEATKQSIQNPIDKKSLQKVIADYVEKCDEAKQKLSDLATALLNTISEAGYSKSDFKQYSLTFISNIAAGELNAPSKTATELYGSTSPEEWFTKAILKKKDNALLELASTIQPLYDEIYSNYNKVCTLANSAKLLRKNYRSYAVLYDLYNKSTEICREENSMILSQTKSLISELISESDAPFIYEKVGNRFDHFMIDEFQDTSRHEWENFLPLLNNAMAQSDDISVFLVGDIKQSIYRWRGSDWDILSSVAPHDIGEANLLLEPLYDNYRSLPNIVGFNNLLFDNAVRNDDAQLANLLNQALKQGWISKEKFDKLDGMLLTAYGITRDDKAHTEITAKRKTQHKGYIAIHDINDTSVDIIPTIREVLNRGFNPCDITILVRKKSDSYAIAASLLSFKESEGYDFDVMTQEALQLSSSPEVVLILAIMRLAINRNDAVSLGLYNRYLKNGDFSAALNDEEMAFLDSISMLSPEEAFEHIIMRFPQKGGATAYVQALQELVVRFCSSRVADIALFLDWWDEHCEKESVTIEKSRNTIEIMTIHKAKGLENKVIIIPYCDWPLTPNSNTSIIWAKPSKESGIEELEKFPVSFSSKVGESIFSEDYYNEIVYSHVEAVNLLYVALTRAKEELHIFIPKKIRSNGPNVGNLILDTLHDIPSLTIASTDSGEKIYEYGEKTTPEPTDEEERDDTEQITLNESISSPIALHQAMSSARYFDESKTIDFTPQNRGISLHRMLENAVTRDDVFKALNQMSLDGIISRADIDEIRNKIEAVLSQSPAKEWFDGSWEKVYCESNIVTNNNKYRPDRVMLREDKTVVVDYKFGEHEEEHSKQVGNYCNLLEDMGYKNISGYLWYVGKGEIIKAV